jgi:hypothetical protein
MQALSCWCTYTHKYIQALSELLIADKKKASGPVNCKHTYSHTCIHIYIYTYIHTGTLEAPNSWQKEGFGTRQLQTYIFTYMHTYIYIYTYIQALSELLVADIEKAVDSSIANPTFRESGRSALSKIHVCVYARVYVYTYMHTNVW